MEALGINAETSIQLKKVDFYTSHEALLIDYEKSFLQKYKNKIVIDGDKTDLRTAKNDGSNVIVGLRFKGSKKDLDSHLDNFVIDTK